MKKEEGRPQRTLVVELATTNERIRSISMLQEHARKNQGDREKDKRTLLDWGGLTLSEQSRDVSV